jgi:hypothetical protein
VPNNDEFTKNIRKESGDEVAVADRLEVFLYHLMRDHLSFGVVEELVQLTESVISPTVQYSNGWAARYAMYLAKRLRTNR